MVPLSVLDLVPVRAGATATDALREAVDLARHAERLGYLRYWFAEHHGMASIASSAPEILIEHIASATTRHSRRLGRHHAAEPRAAARGRGVPHARGAASRPHRPRPRPRARHRSRNLARAAPVRRRAVSRPGARAAGALATNVSAGAPVRDPCASCPPTWRCRRSGCWRRAARRPRLPARSGWATASRGTSARTRRCRPFAPIASTSCPRRSSLAARHPRRVGDLRADRRGGRVSGGVHRPGLGAAAPARVRAAAEPGGGAWPISTRRRSGSIVETNRQRHFIGTPFKVASTIRQSREDTGADEIMVTSMMYGRDARFRSYELLAHEWGLRVRPRPRISVTFFPGWVPPDHRSPAPKHGPFQRLSAGPGPAGILSSSQRAQGRTALPLGGRSARRHPAHDGPADRSGGGAGLSGAGRDPARPAARHPSVYVASRAERGVTLIPGIERTIQGKHVLLLNFSRALGRRRQLRRSRRVSSARAGLVIAPHPFFPGIDVPARPDGSPSPICSTPSSTTAMFTSSLNFNIAAERWARAHGKPMVGNGDVHRLRQLGYDVLAGRCRAGCRCESARRSAPARSGRSDAAVVGVGHRHHGRSDDRARYCRLASGRRPRQRQLTVARRSPR